MKVLCCDVCGSKHGVNNTHVIGKWDKGPVIQDVCLNCLFRVLFIDQRFQLLEELTIPQLADLYTTMTNLIGREKVVVFLLEKSSYKIEEEEEDE